MLRSSYGIYVFLTVVVAIATACTNRNGAEPSKSLLDVFALGLVTFLAISLLLAVSRLEKGPTFQGIFLGLIAGAMIIISVPIEIQYIVLGMILGVGADFVSGVKKEGGPQTIVNSLADLSILMNERTKEVAKSANLRKEKTKNAMILIWWILGTIVLMLMIGRIFVGISVIDLIPSSSTRVEGTGTIERTPLPDRAPSAQQ